MEVIIKKDFEEMSLAGARVVAKVINGKPNAVLGLAAGETPLGLYKELIRMHKEEGLDFSQVRTFNLDEYVGLPKHHPQSYNYFMHENLFVEDAHCFAVKLQGTCGDHAGDRTFDGCCNRL